MFSKDLMHYTMKCPTCGDDVEPYGFSQTLVSYSSPPGHDHDFNWLEPLYRCGSCTADPPTTATWEGPKFRAACWCGQGQDGGAGFPLTEQHIAEWKVAHRPRQNEPADAPWQDDPGKVVAHGAFLGDNPEASPAERHVAARELTPQQRREKMQYAAERYVSQYVPKDLRNQMLVLVRECIRLGMELECIEPEGPQYLLAPATAEGSHAIKFVVYPEANDSERWRGIPFAFTMKLEMMHDPDLAKVEYEILRRANSKALADHVAEQAAKRARLVNKAVVALLDGLCGTMEELFSTKDFDGFMNSFCHIIEELPAELVAQTKFAKSELFELGGTADALPKSEEVVVPLGVQLAMNEGGKVE